MFKFYYLQYKIDQIKLLYKKSWSRFIRNGVRHLLHYYYNIKSNDIISNLVFKKQKSMEIIFLKYVVINIILLCFTS